MVPLLAALTEPEEAALHVFAIGVTSALWLVFVGGLLFGTLRLIRRFMGVGSDV